MKNNEEIYEESKSNVFRFGSEGDFLKGTLVSVAKTSKPDSYGKLSNIYTVKAQEGKFIDSTKNEKGKYVDDTEPTIITEGENYAFFISHGKGFVIGEMNKIKVGQKFKIQFVESKPTDKGNDLKVIKVFAGKNADGTPLMDKEWIEQQGGTLEDF